MAKAQNILSMFGKILLTIIIITIFEFIALVLVTMIPQEKIKIHVTESADILLEDTVFFYLNKNDISSRIDRYADSILLNIAYSYDNEHPIKSVACSSYYYNNTQNENQNLKDAVSANLHPNTDYLRYWHGSNIIVKPLLLFTNINGIYAINALVIIILLTFLLILLQQRLNKGTSICLLVACATVSIWYVPFSLEYTWSIIIMLLAGILSFSIYNKKPVTYICFFVIIGNITAYFDFLSTETLTFTIPIICILLLKDKEHLLHNTQNYFTLTIKAGLSWLTGYISAWIMKWTVASIILQTNAFQLALHQANTRITGEVENISFFNQALGALVRNVSCLFPFSYIQGQSFMIALTTAGIIAIFYYLFRDSHNTTLPMVLCMIASIPFVRFVLISNHSYLHYFFTYRAQLASIFAFGLAIIYGIDYHLLKKELRKICKRTKKS